MSKSKNLACPFCGSRQSHIVKYDGDIWRNCLKCGASTRPCHSVKAATTHWNERAGGRQPAMSKTAGTKHDGNSDLLAAQVKNFEASNKKTLKLSRKLRKESPEAAWLRGQSAGFN